MQQQQQYLAIVSALAQICTMMSVLSSTAISRGRNDSNKGDIRLEKVVTIVVVKISRRCDFSALGASHMCPMHHALMSRKHSTRIGQLLASESL